MAWPAEDGAWLAWLSGAGALSLIIVAVRAASMRAAGTSTAIALLGTAVLIYKNAFVRADSHRLSFFASALFFAALLAPPRCSDGAPCTRRRSRVEPIQAWDPAWGARPRLLVAPFPTAPVECGGVLGMSLHARTDVFFDAPPGPRRVTGHTGVCSGNESRGLTLLLGVDGPEGFRIAWGRTLSAEAARRAPRLDIDVVVEVGPEDTVVL